MRYTKGLFGFSADPITRGHLDVIQKSLTECETLVVLIANNPKKEVSYIFSLEQRAALTRSAIQTLPKDLQSRITVMTTSGLLIDTYLTEHCDVIIRGIRNSHDELFENEQRSLYTVMLPALADRFLYIEADPAYSAISSSWVKELVRSHVDVSALVPLSVKAALEFRIHEQKFIGVTGPIASGKTTLAQNLVKELQALEVDAHHIVIDDLVRELYTEQSLGAQAMRENIIAEFGETVSGDKKNSIDTKTLTKKLFSGTPEQIQEHRAFLEKQTAPHVYRLLRNALANKSGIIFIEWADFTSQDLLPLVNNNLIVLDTPLETRARYAAARSIAPTMLDTISATQHTVTEITDHAKHEIQAAVSGQLFIVTPETKTKEFIEDLLNIRSLPTITY